MPREVVLRLPPSHEPPAPGVTDGAAVEAMRAAAAQSLNVSPGEVREVRVRKFSFDARRRERCWRVIADVWTGVEQPPERVVPAPPTYDRPADGARHVVVVGCGPAGMFCALDLLKAGLRVTLVERGGDVRARRRPVAELNRGKGVDSESNYCFGEGGAGTYSDGKLYTRSGKKSAIREVLRTLVEHGAPEEILASWRPHVGSNRLPGVVQALRETILRSGGKVRFHTRVEEILTRDGRATGVKCRDLMAEEDIVVEADAVVLATGHSALDTLRTAARAGARLEAKGFAMGVRAEHGQEWLDDQQYGGLRVENELPASFYELAQDVDERGVYSFCMCPGGFIVPATTGAERIVVNGMSLSRRNSPFANSGVVVSIEPEDWCGQSGLEWGFDDLLRRAAEGSNFARESASGALPDRPDQDPLFGVRLQHALEILAQRVGGGALRAPSQRVDQFVDGVAGDAALPTSYQPGLTPCSLDDVLPRGIARRLHAGLLSFDRRLPGYVSERGQLVGVETRTSSPVRISRDRETLECPTVAGLYPCGEGAGFAGGIISAAIDGQRVAASVAAAERAAESG